MRVGKYLSSRSSNSGLKPIALWLSIKDQFFEFHMILIIGKPRRNSVIIEEIKEGNIQEEESQLETQSNPLTIEAYLFLLKRYALSIKYGAEYQRGSSVIIEEIKADSDPTSNQQIVSFYSALQSNPVFRLNSYCFQLLLTQSSVEGAVGMFESDHENQVSENFVSLLGNADFFFFIEVGLMLFGGSYCSLQRPSIYSDSDDDKEDENQERVKSLNSIKRI